MATIQKRNGSWRVLVRRAGHKTLTRTFDRKSEAEQWGREMDVLLDKKMSREHRGDVEEKGHFRTKFDSSLRDLRATPDSGSLTLDSALLHYEQDIIPTLKGANRDRSKVRIIRAHPIASRPLAEISGRDLAEFRDHRLKSVSEATVIKELGLISRVFNTAIREWNMDYLTNPVQNVRKPKTPPGRTRRLRDNETEWILRNTGSFFLESILRFAIDSGMRQSEIATMDWSQVDLEKGIVHLPVTKNGEPRSVPLSNEGKDILKQMSGQKKNFQGYVWDVTPHAISVMFRRARDRARKAYEESCEKNGTLPDPLFLKDLTFHDLRYEAISRFFEEGFNPMEVSLMTGHKDLRSLNRYANLKNG